jgi:hypothetical protein
MLPESPASSRSLLALTLALASGLTLLNAVKPLHVDDATFYFNAAQIAAHPLDPYGYRMMRFDEPVPALTALAPPVLPGWWAAAIRLFGPRPWLWKLWLFPFALLFVGSSAALLRRFAAPVAAPLLAILVLSPVFLPSLNLMMDIPSLALALTALVLFLRACDRNSLVLTVVAGLMAGLAMQTKYTAFLALAAVLVHALLNRKLNLGLLAILTAGATFTVWEAALVFRYGQSHFYYQLTQGDNGDQPKSVLIGALCPLLGGIAPPLILLALTVLRLSRHQLFVVALLVLLPYLLVWTDTADPSIGEFERLPIRLSDVLFGCLGAVMLLSLAGVAWRLVRPARTGRIVFPSSPEGCLSWFLVLWLVLELAGYVLISPFPAVRRIMGITVVATLLIGRLAVASPWESWRRNVLRGLVAMTALLGLCFFAVDYLEARAEQQAAYEAVRRIRQEHPRNTIWYAGYWGFQFYAEQAGMKQAVPLHLSDNRGAIDLSASHFHKDDWLVLPGKEVPQQQLCLGPESLELMDEVVLADSVPLSTLPWYYAGAPPLRHHRGPRLVVRLFRVKKDLVPGEPRG